MLSRPLQQGVANHEQRETAVPEHIEPGAGLGPRTEETAARNQTGKGQYQRHRRERGEEIPARRDEDGTQSRSLKSDEQETGRYQTIEPTYRFRNRDEGLDARQRDPGKRGERTERDKGRDDDSQRTSLCIKRCRCNSSGSSGHLSICHGIDDPEDDLEVQCRGVPGWLRVTANIAATVRY
jgi:hypothetical protein